MNRAVWPALSMVVWWSAAGVVLWLVGPVFGWSPPFLGCVLSGLFLGGIGEVADRLRRLWKGRRAART
ncbi:hypothetical protein [Streptomyces sp. NPDC005435]|uniref:hypothetical protein n=1 Tax=Streptomyces sp. NPDC005435 TaxID=3154464 RepID=UPI003455FA4E